MENLERRDWYLRICLPAFQKACCASCFILPLAVCSLNLGSAAHLFLTMLAVTCKFINAAWANRTVEEGIVLSRRSNSSSTSKEAASRSRYSWWRGTVCGLSSRLWGATAAIWMAADVCCIHGVFKNQPTNWKGGKKDWREKSTVVHAVLSEYCDCMCPFFVLCLIQFVCLCINTVVVICVQGKCRQHLQNSKINLV